MLNDISITSGFPVVKGDSPDNSDSRNAIVLVGLGPATELKGLKKLLKTNCKYPNNQNVIFIGC